MRPPFPGDEPRRFDDDERRWNFSLTPATLGLLLFLLSLTIFFFAAIGGYIVARRTSPTAPAEGTLELPVTLWISTLVIIFSGVTMHFAQRAASRGILGHLRLYLVLTLLLGAVFIGLQIPALATLLTEHRAQLQQQMALYGFTSMLIGLHALHVVGGFVPLGVLTWRAMSEIGPHPRPQSVALMEIYWHFLHLIWLIMFIVFLAFR